MPAEIAQVKIPFCKWQVEEVQDAKSTAAFSCLSTVISSLVHSENFDFYQSLSLGENYYLFVGML